MIPQTYACMHAVLVDHTLYEPHACVYVHLYIDALATSVLVSHRYRHCFLIFTTVGMRCGLGRDAGGRKPL